jgi:translation initiation factor IF-2
MAEQKGEQKLGLVTHYFGHLQVAAIELTDGELKTGDTIHIKGKTSDFTQRVESMQVEHKSVEKAAKGQVVGLRVEDYVRVHDTVYKTG